MKIDRLVRLGLVAMLTLGAAGLTGCGASDADGAGRADSALSGTVNVAGSDTMVNLANVWAEAFMDANPDVDIAVKGGGSGNGIAALINGSVDLANASREVKDEEEQQAQAKGVDIVETAVARDGIAVIVNAALPVEGLTVEQLGKIYRGEVTNWKQLGGPDEAIVLLSRDSSSGTYEYFKEAVVGKDANYAKSAKLLASNQAIVDEVKGNAAAIGYIGLGYENADTKVLKVDGVAATVETVTDASYPLSRELYIASDGQPSGLLATYLDWILGEEGQKVVAEQGFVPLR